jgi:hypothetical protein
MFGFGGQTTILILRIAFLFATVMKSEIVLVQSDYPLRECVTCCAALSS